MKKMTRSSAAGPQRKVDAANGEMRIRSKLLGPQTREIVVDNYSVVDHKKLSITKKPVCELASYR